MKNGTEEGRAGDRLASNPIHSIIWLH